MNSRLKLTALQFRAFLPFAILLVSLSAQAALDGPLSDILQKAVLFRPNPQIVSPADEHRYLVRLIQQQIVLALPEVNRYEQFISKNQVAAFADLAYAHKIKACLPSAGEDVPGTPHCEIVTALKHIYETSTLPHFGTGVGSCHVEPALYPVFVSEIVSSDDITGQPPQIFVDTLFSRLITMDPNDESPDNRFHGWTPQGVQGGLASWPQTPSANAVLQSFYHDQFRVVVPVLHKKPILLTEGVRSFFAGMPSDVPFDGSYVAYRFAFLPESVTGRSLRDRNDGEEYPQPLSFYLVRERATLSTEQLGEVPSEAAINALIRFYTHGLRQYRSQVEANVTFSNVTRRNAELLERNPILWNFVFKHAAVLALPHETHRAYGVAFLNHSDRERARKQFMRGSEKGDILSTLELVSNRFSHTDGDQRVYLEKLGEFYLDNNAFYEFDRDFYDALLQLIVFKGQGRGGKLDFSGAARLLNILQQDGRLPNGHPDLKTNYENIMALMEAYHGVIRKAIERENLEELQRVFELSGLSLQTKIYKDFSAIDYAVILKRLNALKLLIKLGAPVNSMSIHKSPLLTIAAQNGWGDGVLALIAAGARLDHPGRMGITPLWAAVEKGQFEAMQILVAHHINKGIDLNPKDVRGRTPYMIAVEKKSWTMAAYLANEGAKADLATLNNQLLRAARNGDTADVEPLIFLGAQVNSVPTGTDGPLHVALRGKHWEIARKFLKLGASHNHVGAGGVTPLKLATSSGDSAVMGIILGINARIRMGIPLTWSSNPDL